jgi:hypothetical protein
VQLFASTGSRLTPPCTWPCEPSSNYADITPPPKVTSAEQHDQVFSPSLERRPPISVFLASSRRLQIRKLSYWIAGTGLSQWLASGLRILGVLCSTTEASLRLFRQIPCTVHLCRHSTLSQSEQPKYSINRHYGDRSWSEFLATDPEVRVRFPGLPDFLRSSGSATGSTQPRNYN